MAAIRKRYCDSCSPALNRPRQTLLLRSTCVACCSKRRPIRKRQLQKDRCQRQTEIRHVQWKPGRIPRPRAFVRLSSPYLAHLALRSPRHQTFLLALPAAPFQASDWLARLLLGAMPKLGLRRIGSQREAGMPARRSRRWGSFRVLRNIGSARPGRNGSWRNGHDGGSRRSLVSGHVGSAQGQGAIHTVKKILLVEVGRVNLMSLVADHHDCVRTHNRLGVSPRVCGGAEAELCQLGSSDSADIGLNAVNTVTLVLQRRNGGPQNRVSVG